MLSRSPRRKKRLKILVTAGPTREKIDPVRFISNYSTGRFGYAIAHEAERRGAAVTLVSGPTALPAPKGVKLVRVETALEMKKAVDAALPRVDCLIMAAAVSDWRVRHRADNKIKRSGAGTLELIDNPDILLEAGKRKKRPVLVGFALETEDLKRNALKKLKRKNLDIIIANRLGPGQGVFGNIRSNITIWDRFENQTVLRRKTKQETAKIVLDKVFQFKLYSDVK